MDSIFSEAEKSDVAPKRTRGRPRNPEGRKVTAKGYVIIRQDDGKWIGEHIAVMEEQLGRKLIPGESVQWKDGDKTNNDVTNLELWIGNSRFGMPVRFLKCPHCGESYGE